MTRPKVTAYITCHNYGRYLRQAVESVLRQSLQDFELLLVNDGSSDKTEEIMQEFAAAHPERVRCFSNPSQLGLARCANLALDQARGKYFIRLDADDYFDESALLVLATYLDQHPEVALVYPNFYYVDAQGRVLGVEDRRRVGEEVELLDLPAHGAGTMVRVRALKALGGYSEATDRQDGYDLWLRITSRFQVANVGTALFYYRQHEASLSHRAAQLLSARAQVKRRAVASLQGDRPPRVLGLIPVKNTYPTMPNIALAPVGGRPLVEHTLAAAQEAGVFDRITMAVDDPAVVEYCSRYSNLELLLRPPELSGERVKLAEVAGHAVNWLEADVGYYPDIVVLLSIHSPLRRAEYIGKAVDTLRLYPVDSVISVYEDYTLHYVHGRNGLTPLNKSQHQRLRFEREALYVHNGAVKALWRETLTREDLLGGRIGHIVMPHEDSFEIKSLEDLEIVDAILAHRMRVETAG